MISKGIPPSHKMNRNRVLIVGAGFSGAVLARELAEQGSISSLVIDSRPHLGGNCHTERDEISQIMVHTYGPHIFHTDRKEIWDYVNRFGEFKPFVNRVKASIDRGIFSMPVNLHTINQFFGKKFSPSEAKQFFEKMASAAEGEPRNFEDQALKMLGKDLYECFFKGYTIKQWGCHPSELPASILKRLPVRFNYDDNYYNDPFQGIPKDGYTSIVGAILNHPKIEVKLNSVWEETMKDEFEHIFFTGPLDEFYSHKHGRLGYRTVFWERKEGMGDMQGNAVINYPGLEEKFTRIHEHKHFAPWETHERSMLFTEYSRETGPGDIPYYPKRLDVDKAILARYVEEAKDATKISFLGRLATYRYLDMHQVIGESIEFARRFISLDSSDVRIRFSFVSC